MKLLIYCLLTGLLAISLAGTGEAKGGRTPSEAVLVRTDESGQPLWKRTYRFGYVTSIKAATVTRQGGFAMAGWADSCAMHFGLWLAVTDGDGNLLWQHCYAPTAKVWYHFPIALIQLPNGNFIVAGEGSWILCISESGDLLWSRVYDTGECRAVIPHKDGGFVLAGLYGWVLKVDSLGNEEWRKTFKKGIKSYIYDATISPDGKIVAAGAANDKDHPDEREQDGWVVILDSKGRILRNEIFGRSVGIRFANVWNAPNGEYLLHGRITIPKSYMSTTGDELMMRISATGDSIWSRGRKDGWEADSGEAESVGKLPHGYFDQVIGMESPCHIGHLIAALKLPDHNIWGEAGFAPGGYFYTERVNLSKESSEPQSVSGHSQ